MSTAPKSVRVRMYRLGLGDAFLLTSKHGSGATKTRRNLVSNQQHTGSITELARSGQKTRRLEQHAGGPLNQRLDDKGRQ